MILEPAEQPAQFGAQDRVVGQAGKQRFDRVEHDPLGADRVDGVAEANEQPLEVILAGFLDLAALDADVIDGELVSATSRPRSKPSEATFLASSSSVSSKEMKTPGSPYSSAPSHKEVRANSVLPQPAPPQISVGRLQGSPPPVISSSPLMPDGTLTRGVTAAIAKPH